MKPTICLAAILSTSALAEPLPVVWSLTDGVQAPESACVYGPMIFVSQIGGGGGKAKDGDGWISKLRTDGKVLKAKFATGLNAPKGLGVDSDGKLWVADIDRIVAFSVESGRQLEEVKVPGAQFLNDITTGSEGEVYVSDMLAGKIHRYKAGKLELFAKGDEIGHPNGLLYRPGQLIVGDWGRDIQDDFSTKTPGHLLSIDLKTKKVAKISNQPFGNLDGIVHDGENGYIVSDWISGKIYHVSEAEGTHRELASYPKGAADIGYLADKKQLLLPEMLQNKVSALRIDLTAKP